MPSQGTMHPPAVGNPSQLCIRQDPGVCSTLALDLTLLAALFLKASLQKCLFLTHRERFDQIEIISMQNEKSQGTGLFSTKGQQGDRTSQS